jgi:uracil-DNA glycosylase
MYKVFPRPTDIFTAFKLTPPSSVKVVILSQDPYPFGNHAHGLAFSSLQRETPASLRVIFREVDREIFKTYTHEEFKRIFPVNNLTAWAKQGVFLLNTTLTVRAEVPNSHNHLGWDKFTRKVLELLAADPRFKVFLVWGKDAGNQLVGLENACDNHKILTTGHPASGSHGKDLFSGCGHFFMTNYLLKKNNLEPINWSLNENSSN